MEKTSIKKNVLLSTAYQILVLLIPFITAPYISRVLGADGIGIYSYTQSIQLYFSLFAALGTATYGAREIARNRDNKEKRSKLFWEIELLTVITSSICLLIWFILIFFSKEYKIFYLILTMNILNTMFDISWFYTGLEQIRYTVFKNLIFRIIGVILLFVFIKSSDDLILYVFLMTLTTLLGTLSMWVTLPKFITKVNKKELKILPHLKETLVYFIPTIATSIYTVLDKTLIGIITNDNKENGYYEQATKIINMTKALTFASLNTVLGARISYLFAENKFEEVRQRINNSMNYILFLGFGLMFGLIGIANNFVPLFFGEGYDKVTILIKLLSPLVIIIGISNCLGSHYYTPAGFRRKSTKYLIVGACINLILNIVLIPKYWSYGAAIATIIAETIITILYLMNCNNYLNYKDLLKYSWKKIVAGIIMLLVVYLISYIQINLILVLILQVCSGALIYSVVLILFKDEFIINVIKYQILEKIKFKTGKL